MCLSFGEGSVFVCESLFSVSTRRFTQRPTEVQGKRAKKHWHRIIQYKKLNTSKRIWCLLSGVCNKRAQEEKQARIVINSWDLWSLEENWKWPLTNSLICIRNFRTVWYRNYTSTISTAKERSENFLSILNENVSKQPKNRQSITSLLQWLHPDQPMRKQNSLTDQAIGLRKISHLLQFRKIRKFRWKLRQAFQLRDDE